MTTVNAGPGADRVFVEAIRGTTRVYGQGGDDWLVVNAVPDDPTAPNPMNGRTLRLDGGASSDSYIVGLFGKVWGIMDAFLRIGVEKSASLPVVAPAIGEALIATAFGLVAAIPATIGYNFVDKRIGDLLEELSAGSEVWVELLASERIAGETPAVPLTRERELRFPAQGGG